MNTKSQYFIHIGPPKTATTSLQEYFINNDFENITYEGILQPRDKNDKTLCKNIYREVTSECNLNPNDLGELIKEDNNTEIRFLSEEMFLVETPQFSWKAKIERLHGLTSLIEPTVLVVLRDPISAIRSYYQEMFYHVDRTKIKSINDFAKSSYCEIYRYDDLIKFLSEAGFKKIKTLEFKKLINGQYTFDDIFNNSDRSKLILPQKNISKKEGDNFYANHTTIKKVVLANTPSLIRRLIGDRLKRKIYSLVPDLKLNKGELLNVEIKQEIVYDFLESYEKVLSN